MIHLLRIALAALAMLLAAGAAQAQGSVAFATRDVHLRAGPARDYPVVAVIPAGAQLLVQGCLPDYRWCDVLAGGSRGWVYAGNISSVYQGASVPLINYGTLLGIGVLGFILDDYWNDHYRGRPWYGERDRWVHRPRVRPAPRPLPLPRPDVHPPRPPQHAVPLAPRPPGQPHLPGVTPRPPRDAQPRAPRPEGQRSDVDRRGEHQR
jgi:uncharacterized protein YraI